MEHRSFGRRTGPRTTAVLDLQATLAAGDSGRKAFLSAMLAATECVRRELWRFRPDLSICRAPATGCLRPLGIKPTGR